MLRTFFQQLHSLKSSFRLKEMYVVEQKIPPNACIVFLTRKKSTFENRCLLKFSIGIKPVLFQPKENDAEYFLLPEVVSWEP